MSKKIQDLEQELLRCWEVTLDLKLLAEIVNDGSNNTDTVNGLAEVYELRFNKAWDTFEKVVEEYYAWKPREVNFDELVDPLCKICGKVLGSTKECAWTGCPLNWGDEASEKRQDIIGQNGNVGYGEE
jgi:hypothetical protein